MITWTVTRDGPETKPKPNIFHQLWAELHSTQYATPEWFNNWLSRIPCGECRDHTRAYIAANPVDFDNLKQWACNFHNAVNVRLGKPIWNPLDSSA